MKQLADDVFQLQLTPRNGINAFLLGDVLVDAGMPGSAKKILKSLSERSVSTHVLTHAHLDHIGGSPTVCRELGIPMWCGAADAEAARSGQPVVADTRAKSLVGRFGKFAAAEVARELREGDPVGPGFIVLDTPGHSPGHISLWRESDRTLVCGDVFNTMNLLTTVRGLHEPPTIFTPDVARNRASERRVAELEPALMLVGHGPPWRDPAAIKAFTARLSA
jgi:hydroxyacylglutathione hydrolase